MTALVNEQRQAVERYAYSPWGERINPSNLSMRDTRYLKLARGYTMHEHLDMFGIINMNGRVYDPLTAMFFSPDPFVTYPNDWLNYNRYLYGLGNPFKYTDPNGENPILVAIVLGALINGFVAGVQMDMSGQGNFLDGFWRGALVGAATGALGSIAPLGTAWLGSTLWGAAVGTASSAGMVWASGSKDYSNIWQGTLTGATSGFLSSQNFRNLVKGKGFNTNDAVLKNFVAGKYNTSGFDTWQDAALDYFGFEGKYDPSNPLFNVADNNNAGAITNATTGDIFYNDLAFEHNFDRLKFTADHEYFHSQNVTSGKFKNVKIDDIVKGEEEWSVWQKNYTRQGFYPKSGITSETIINNINAYGFQGYIYGISISPYGTTLTSLKKQWWHFIYKIPRRW